jgi:predicted ester cyclase
MSTEQNKANARRLLEEAWSGGNLAVVDELVSTNIVARQPLLTLAGQEAYKRYISELHSAFPNLHYTIEDLIGEGDRVVIRWSGHYGTHQGPLRGLPATGKEASSTGITISRFVDGKDVEEWMSADTLGLLQRLGVVPSTEQLGIVPL